MQEFLEKAYEAGKVFEEVLLDGVVALGKEHEWVEE